MITLDNCLWRVVLGQLLGQFAGCAVVRLKAGCADRTKVRRNIATQNLQITVTKGRFRPLTNIQVAVGPIWLNHLSVDLKVNSRIRISTWRLSLR